MSLISSVSNPARMLAIYGGITGLVYVETDGFRREAPFMFVLPVLALAVLTMALRMKPKTKYLTCSSFITIAIGLYLSALHRRELHYMCAIISLSHILYLLSFLACIRRLWHGLAITMTVYLLAVVYYCFADVFRSIPFMVSALSLHLAVICASVVAAGSVWQYGSKRTDAQQAALFRFIGLLVCLGCSTMVIVSQFGQRYYHINCALRIAHYVAQGLLFFANERAF
uniref:Protein kinase domain-containing protein n=1 Tax=Parascaris univalens TaxID=6257 RepID=A0A915BPI0_PARUN